MTIRIPDGNAFRIRLTARNLISGEYTEAADLSNIDNLVINYVRRGIRFPHAYTIDEEGRATVADAGTLDCGFYGIELTGYYGGEKFRFYGKDLFEITTDTTDVIDPSNLIDIEITVKLNASGVSKDYVDHAVNGMEASMETMQADLRDEIAEAGKVDDVKVNGVSVVFGKKANITVPTKVSDLNNDLGYQNEQQVQQKVDAAKITSADISVDGGTGTPSGSAGVSGNQLVIALHNIKGEKGDPGESIVGPQGPQGDSFQPIEDVSGLVLAHTTGLDNTKAMSQKGVTDAIIKATKYDLEEVDVSEIADNAYYIVSSTKKWLPSNSTSQTTLRRTKLVPVTSGRYLLKKEDGVISNYTVLRSNNYASGVVADFASGYNTILPFNEENEIEIVVPTDGTLLYYFSQKDNGDTVKIDIYKIGESALAQEVGNNKNKAISQDAATRQFEKEDIKTDYGELVSEDSLLTSANTWVNNKYFKSDGTGGNSSGWKACADIYVTDYDFVRVSLCEVSSAAYIIFIDANNQCIVDESIAGAGTGTGAQPYYREIVVKVPTNAVRLGISAMMDESTYGTPYCYGQKFSGGIIKANETREILDKDRLGDVQVVKAPQWINGYIDSTGQGHLTNDYWLTYPFKADKIYSLRSIAQTPVNLRVNYYDKDMNHLGLVVGGTEITSLAMDCEYIRVWFDNAGTPPDTQLEIKKYVGGNAQYPRLDGKAIVTFGDSITWYDGRFYLNGDEEGIRVKGYQSYMRGIGMMVDNQGISGYTMPQIYNEEVVPYTRFGVVDYVTIFSGANDSKNGVAVGEVAEIGSTFNTATYIGALQAIIEHVLNINTQVKIVLFTPIKGWNYRSGVPPMTKREYVDAVKAVGKVYSLPVIDIYDTIGLNEITRDAMINDPEPTSSEYDSSHPYSLHPSTYGYKRMADIILPQLAQA